jgi:uncharacterized OB-fold protein
MTTSAQVEPFVVDQHWDLTYNHTADPVTAHFLRSLGDEGKLLGIRCPVCERVLTPPRPFCDRDFCDTEGWVELGMTGTLELFTIMNLKIAGLPDPPYVLAYVKPVDVSSMETALEQLSVGAAVDIKLRDERQGRITDLYFQLAE